MTAFPEAAKAIFASFYPEIPAKMSHGLSNHPLLTMPALAELAAGLPEKDVEYNSGGLPIGIKVEEVPLPRLGIAETIRSIEENGSWMVLKLVEQHPAYRTLIENALAELRPLVAPRTGEMLTLQGFIFISSPEAVTPFHFDPEHNILLQICGEKVMTVFSPTDETIVSPLAHETFHLGQHHRNLDWKEDFAARGTAFALTPGDAFHVPVKAPHWVKNGPQVSISLSITWRSTWSYEEADARAFNHLLRKFGMTPASPRRLPRHNRAKSLAYRTLRRLGLTG
jgi:hypothetical protein